MEDSLASIIRPVDTPYQKRPYVERKPVEAPTIEIAGISSIGMHYNLRQPENEAFTTSLYKIDSLLE
jgi:hypothetical protein